MSKKVKVSNKRLTGILASIKQINASDNNPFGWPLVKNEKKVQSKVDDYLSLLNDIRAKYCNKSIEFKGLEYELKDDIKKVFSEASDKARGVMMRGLDFVDFKAKKQDEYEAKIKEAAEAIQEFELSKISMSEKIVISEDETITIDQKIKRDGVIKAAWLVPLMDHILID